MKITPSWVCQLNPAVAIEDFGERSLALHCIDLRLVELNAMARDLLARLDGQINLHQVAETISNEYNQPVESVLHDVQSTITQMAQLGIVEEVSKTQHKLEDSQMATTDIRYIANPDVSCREEGPDGALLFNPDTDDVLVVNVTGLLIWQALTEPRTQTQVVETLLEQCKNVPEDNIAGDVSEFVGQLVEREFARTEGAN